MSTGKRWIGVDFDGTLAEYHGWTADGVPGEPIKLMVDRVKKWLEEGREVRIVTARVCSMVGIFEAQRQRVLLQMWCYRHIGRALPITAEKDTDMEVLYDDRAVAVERNTGNILFWDKDITP